MGKRTISNQETIVEQQESPNEIKETIEQLRARLVIAEKAEQEKRDALRKSVKREWKFTLTLCSPSSFQPRLYDSTLEWWLLRGEVVNKEALMAVGHDASSDYLRGGSMRYLYNRRTGCFAMRDGGGSLFLVGESEFDRKDEKLSTLHETICQLECFMRAYENGGDVTSIIINQKGFSW